MKTLKFEIKIAAPAQKVWKSLWEDSNYRQWTAAFHQGSHAESDWIEGSPIEFLGPSNNDGMFAVIQKMIPNKKMVFKHLGSILAGQKIESEWTNAVEEYILEEENGQTTLRVFVDVVEQFEQDFNNSFMAGLKIVKSLSEENK